MFDVQFYENINTVFFTIRNHFHFVRRSHRPVWLLCVGQNEGRLCAEQHYTVNLCNGNSVCLLWSRIWTVLKPIIQMNFLFKTFNQLQTLNIRKLRAAGRVWCSEVLRRQNLALSYRHFGTTCCSHLHENKTAGTWSWPSTQFSTDVKNEWSHTSTLSMPSWHGQGPLPSPSHSLI